MENCCRFAAFIKRNVQSSGLLWRLLMYLVLGLIEIKRGLMLYAQVVQLKW